MGGAAEPDDDFRISIAGAQEKTALTWFEGRWCRPRGSTPTTHIMKLPMGLVGNMRLDLSHSIENEWLCSRILHAYGLPVADCRPVQFEDMKVLAVTRFDRAWIGTGDERWLARLPQEDLCQATATPAMLKYEADGGPGIERIMSVLSTSIRERIDRRTFLITQLLFWMLRAPDGHAKNFSLSLLPRGDYHLTPLYDVMSAWPLIGEGNGRLSEHKIKMAMAIRSANAHWKMKEIQRRHWISLGNRYGVLDDEGRTFDTVVDGLVERTPDVIAGVASALPPGFPDHVATPILEGLNRSAEMLSRR
jgi:serine/threonine-protein kinase HipA